MKSSKTKEQKSMDLKEYFETHEGLGVFSTADSKGRVNSAIFARPHFVEDGKIAWIMGEKTTHSNLTSNPNAAFLVKQDGQGWEGVRLFLKMTGEETDREKIDSLSRRRKYEDETGKETKYLVYFSIENVVPLLGKGTCPVKAEN
jgi:hypothetical protein